MIYSHVGKGERERWDCTHVVVHIIRTEFFHGNLKPVGGKILCPQSARRKVRTSSFKLFDFEHSIILGLGLFH